ncbi:hypothetical protein ACFXI8_27460 [Streptomyces niveus]|uniref:hypothetical protein n=1 Tax=Streptomyces niveus TaxID=193462 RepID=UPI0036AA7196
MNLHIEPVPGAIFVISCLVGYVVYRKPPPPAHPSQPAARNLTEAIAAAAGAMFLLSILFGVGVGVGSEAEVDVEQREEAPQTLVCHACEETDTASS